MIAHRCDRAVNAKGIEDVAFVTGDIHTFFAGDVTRTGRQALRGSETSPVDGPPRATEFVCGAIADTEAGRVAAAAPIDAAVLGNNPQITYSNQAYKGYGVLEARAGSAAPAGPGGLPPGLIPQGLALGAP